MENSLPFAMRVAAYSVQLDYVKVVHTNEQCSNPKIITTLNFNGWEKRLHNKCVKSINDDITKYNKKNNVYENRGNFYIHNNQFVSNYYTKYIIFKCIDLHYTVDTNIRGIKLRKIKEKINGKKRRLE